MLVAVAGARCVTGRPSGRRVRCRRATSSSRRTRCRRCRTGCRSSSCCTTSSRSSACACSSAPAAPRIRRTSWASRIWSRRCSIRGRRRKSAEQMADAIDFIGGAMGAGAASDLSFVNMVVMKDSFEPGLRMLSDMVGIRRSRRRRSIASGSRCCRACRSASTIPSTSPTPCSIGSSTASIRTACRTAARRRRSPGITRDDLVAFHQKYFAPNNAILAIVGDVTAEEAFDAVKKVFGDWERATCRASGSSSRRIRRGA